MDGNITGPRHFPAAFGGLDEQEALDFPGIGQGDGDPAATPVPTPVEDPGEGEGRHLLDTFDDALLADVDTGGDLIEVSVNLTPERQAAIAEMDRIAERRAAEQRQLLAERGFEEQPSQREERRPSRSRSRRPTDASRS